MIFLILTLEKVIYMKNKIIVAFLFTLTMFFIGSYSVKAEETCIGPNLTSDLKNSNNESLPNLCINGGMSYAIAPYYYSHINMKETINDYQYIVVQNNDTTSNYKYYAYIMADYGYYNYGTTYKYVANWTPINIPNYKNGVYISTDLSYLYFTSQESNWSEYWGYSYSSTLNGALSNENMCNFATCAPSGYTTLKSRTMIFKMRYNATTYLWELVNDYFGNQYTFNNGTTPNILYSSFDIYTSNTSDTLYHENDYEEPTAPDTSLYEKIKLYGMYGILFKNKTTPGSEEGSSGGGHGGAINGSDFILYSKWGYTLNYWGDNKVHDNLSLHYTDTLIPNYLTYWLEYSLPEDYFLVDNAILEFVNIEEEPGSEGGSSGGGHSSGDGRHDYSTGYEESNQDIMRYIYFKSYKYDYCILETKDSECTFPDGTTGNDIYDDNDSSDNIFNNMQKFINSKANFVSAFGYIINVIWGLLNSNIKGFIVTSIIAILTIFLIRKINS